jgi:hypothetical protein
MDFVRVVAGCAAVSRWVQKNDLPAASTRVASPIETGTPPALRPRLLGCLRGSVQRQQILLIARDQFRIAIAAGDLIVRRRVAALRSPCSAPIVEAPQCSALAHWAASQAACGASIILLVARDQFRIAVAAGGNDPRSASARRGGRSSPRPAHRPGLVRIPQPYGQNPS